jgi:phosphoglycolate phosphatase-like HAD superfamily hydrolase
MKLFSTYYSFLIASVLLACQSNQSMKPNPTEQIIESDLLISWQDGRSKKSIIDFVTKTTTEGSADFIPEADRIAVFDNDGTLWSEQPMYFQLAYAIDFVKKEATTHPEWKEKEPFKSLLEGNLTKVLAGGEHALVQLVMASHAGMSTEEFESSVTQWLSTAVHPKTGKPYQEMIYQPMIELLEFLRAHQYKTFIVSGGGVDFMRVWAEKAYEIPPYQVIGSSIKSAYEVVDGKPTIVKLPELNFIDDKEGKPIGIHQHIGKQPVFAAGNSDGDYQMLDYTTSGTGLRFGMIVHHTDSIREFAYDRGSSIGRLEKGLDDAKTKGWLVIDMAKDWKTIYPEKSTTVE